MDNPHDSLPCPQGVGSCGHNRLKWKESATGAKHDYTHKAAKVATTAA